MKSLVYYCFFFFQAEDGIRDYKVTGVQTCALPISRHTAADGSILERLVRVHAILRLLHRDGVLHAIFRIQPESRRGLEAGAERNKNVLCDVARLHANGLGTGPIDFHIERGVIKGLLNVDIHRTGNATELVREFFSY